MIQTLARSSSEKTQVDQNQLMIHTVPCYFLFALLGTFSNELKIKYGLMKEWGSVAFRSKLQKGVH